MPRTKKIDARDEHLGSLLMADVHTNFCEVCDSVSSGRGCGVRNAAVYSAASAAMCGRSPGSATCDALVVTRTGGVMSANVEHVR